MVDSSWISDMQWSIMLRDGVRPLSEGLQIDSGFVFRYFQAVGSHRPAFSPRQPLVPEAMFLKEPSKSLIGRSRS